MLPGYASETGPQSFVPAETAIKTPAVLDIVPVLRVLGVLIIAFAGVMLIPVVVEASPLNPPASHFILSAIATAFAGMALVALSPAKDGFEMTRRQGFLLTALSWTILPAFGGLPFLGHGLNISEAYFEAVSAMTTTGSTVFTGLDLAPASILLWRSLMQWIGGVGIIVVGIIMMPFLRVGGMQLFHTESSDTSEKIVAKAFDLAIWIAGIYFALTMMAVATFHVLGMGWFDAINHAMTALSTGGFSTHDASFGYFNSEPLLWAGFVFMAAGALPFVAFIRLAQGNTKSFFSDSQLRAFLGFIVLASMLVAATRSVRGQVPFEEALTQSAFSVMSIVTTTGFVCTDYQLWGPFAYGAFYVFTFVGGCSGSTAGGIKIYRFQIISKLAGAHLSRIISPNRIHVTLYNDRRVEDDVAFSIVAFLAVMLFSLVASTFLLAWFGVDLLTALTASATAMANVGPGLGPIIGPAGNFDPLPDAADWVLSFMMILGRLEFFTIFVLFTPAFWRS